MAQTQSSDADFGFLSAIWILSCNDEIPTMSYQGLHDRIGVNVERAKQLVRSHAELFRHGIPEKRLEKWKNEMLAGRRQPSWVRRVEDLATREQRIRGLTRLDCFRNQFRTKPNSPKASIDILTWGLEHIERLRKAQIETAEQKLKLFSSVVVPIVSSLIALAAVISTYFINRRVTETQVELKRVELSARPKLEGYARIMRALSDQWRYAHANDQQKLSAAEDEYAAAFDSIEPFLSVTKRRDVENSYLKFSKTIQAITAKGQFVDDFDGLRRPIRDVLHTALFAPNEFNSFE